MNEENRRDTNAQDTEDFGNEMLNENRIVEEKNKEIDFLKSLHSETKDLNRQYFRKIFRLKKDYGTLEFACVSELIIIVVLSLVIVP